MIDHTGNDRHIQLLITAARTRGRRVGEVVQFVRHGESRFKRYYCCDAEREVWCLYEMVDTSSRSLMQGRDGMDSKKWKQPQEENREIYGGSNRSSVQVVVAQPGTEARE